MSTELTPSTELDAVNVLLGAAGEARITSLEAPGNLYASEARATLHEVSREVQSRGWWFNELEQYTFTLDAEGRAQAPSAILKITPARGAAPLVVRGGRLFNPRTATDTFAEPPTVATAVLFIEFESLPETARRYIAVRAARLFQTKVLGSETLQIFTEKHEREAFALFAEEHDDFDWARGRNFLRDSRDVAAIWDV